MVRGQGTQKNNGQSGLGRPFPQLLEGGACGLAVGVDLVRAPGDLAEFRKGGGVADLGDGLDGVPPDGHVGIGTDIGLTYIDPVQ